MPDPDIVDLTGPRGHVSLRRADQGQKILLRLRDVVAKKGDPGRVASDAPEMFDDRRAILADRVAQFARGIESIDLVQMRLQVVTSAARHIPVVVNKQR